MFSKKEYFSDTWYLQEDKINDIYEKVAAAKNDKNLSPYDKLMQVLDNLEKVGLLCEMSEALEINRSPSNYVYFNGKARFKADPIYDSLVNLTGYILIGSDKKRNFKCNCSKRYFTKLSSSLFYTLLDTFNFLDNIYLNVFFIGSHISLPSNSRDMDNNLQLSAIYIGGCIEDIYRIFKEQG